MRFLRHVTGRNDIYSLKCFLCSLLWFNVSIFFLLVNIYLLCLYIQELEPLSCIFWVFFHGPCVMLCFVFGLTKSGEYYTNSLREDEGDRKNV